MPDKINEQNTKNNLTIEEFNSIPNFTDSLDTKLNFNYLRWIHNNTDYYNKYIFGRGLEFNIYEDSKSEISRLIKCYRDFLQLQKEIEDLLADIKKEEKEQEQKYIANSKLPKEEQCVIKINDTITERKLRLKSLQEDFNNILKFISLYSSDIPNILDDRVTCGKDEDNNILYKGLDATGAINPFNLDKEKLKYTGTVPKKFDFAVKSHDELGKNLNMMHFDIAAPICGSRFVFLTDDLAMLERALIDYMLTQTKSLGFTEVATPTLAKSQSLYGTGQLPKFKEDLYKIEDHDLYAIPTGEVTLTNIFANRHWNEEDLPIRLTTFTQCFRSEAGSAGRDTKGMIRQHQFGKVEAVIGCTPDQSNGDENHQLIMQCAEQLLINLELPYRIMQLCSGDTGFSSKLTYDFEVWLPSQSKYREISSCSNCGNFQAMRMDARFKMDKKNNDIQGNRDHLKKEKFIYTLNGSTLAVGRTIVAIIENYQNEDGTVTIPKALLPYFNGKTKIVPIAKNKTIFS
jgi:seryl-tRNA synthetase